MNPVAVVERFLASTLADDARDELWDDDAVMEMPYRDSEPRTLRGKRAILAYGTQLRGRLNPSRFSDIRIFPLSDAEQVLAIARFDATVVDSGRVYSDELVQLFTVRSGRVVRRVEYFNPMALRRAFETPPAVLVSDGVADEA